MIVPPFSLVAGVPGIIKKKLGPEMIENLKKHALSYVEYAKAMKMNSHVIQ